MRERPPTHPGRELMLKRLEDLVHTIAEPGGPVTPEAAAAALEGRKVDALEKIAAHLKAIAQK